MIKSNFLRESLRKNEILAREYYQKERLRTIDRLSKNNGIPAIFENSSLENYLANQNPNALGEAQSFVEDFPNAKGLLLSGPPGLGKSHLAAAISKEINKKLYSSYFGNVVDIIAQIKSSYNKNSLITETESIDLMTEKVDLLIIDDLGKETNTDYNLSLIYRIINKLYENQKPLIITTNERAKDLEYKLGSWGPAILSRITAMCKPISLKGQDWRIKNGR